MKTGDKVTTIGDVDPNKPVSVGVYTGYVERKKKGKKGWLLIRWHKGFASLVRPSDLREATPAEVAAAELRRARNLNPI
jgi:hypothetical protein